MSRSRSITIIGVILLLWNLMGVAAFIMQYTMDLGKLAATDPVGARIFAAMPGWLWVVYAIAVGAGTVGALLLLARSKLSISLFMISLVAVLVQFGYTLGATDLIAQKGIMVAAGFHAFVILIAFVQFFYARSLGAKGALR
jgi:hypothetical protein